MGWVKLSDDFARHPKVRRISDAALRVLLESWCYAGEWHTDGLLEPRDCLSWTEDAEEELVRHGLWDVAGDGAVSVHGWLDYNISKAKSEQLREQATERMARVRANKKRTNGGTSEPEPDPLEGREGASGSGEPAPIPKPNFYSEMDRINRLPVKGGE